MGMDNVLEEVITKYSVPFLHRSSPHLQNVYPASFLTYIVDFVDSLFSFVILNVVYMTYLLI
jgi:hypothetical protein